MSRLVIGTRGSALAMWQAHHVRDALRARHPELEVPLEVIKTKGDRVLHTALHQMLDKGLFTKEIQTALLAGTVDLAVHSLKDLPTEPTDGLVLAAVAKREDPADAMVTKGAASLASLGRGAKVFTGSLRRRAQLLHARDDLQVLPIRGNVGTRLRKFDESDADAILFARAGLVRLGLDGRIAQRLDPTEFLPACGQGALGIEIRRDDTRVADRVGLLDDAPTRAAVTAERAFLAKLGGGCQVPVGAHARTGPDGRTLTVTGMVADLEGRRLLSHTMAGPIEESDRLGRDLAEYVLAEGAREILQAIIGHAGDDWPKDEAP